MKTLKERLISKWTFNFEVKVKTLKCVMSSVLLIGGTGVFVWGCLRPSIEIDILAAGGIMGLVGFLFRPKFS